MPRGALIVIIRAFVDESATHGDAADPLLLSCVVSTVQKWRVFDRKWGVVLKNAGVTHIRAHDLIDGSGEFQGIDQATRAEAAVGIDEAMTECLSFGLNTVLWPKDFAAYRDTKGTNLHTLLSSDYGLSFRILLSFLHVHTEKLICDDPHIYIIYETGHKNAGAAGVILKEYHEHFPNGPVKSAAPVRKGAYYGTEAADIRGALVLDIERKGITQISNFDATEESIQRLFETHKVPWFRLPLEASMLAELKDDVILSRPKFMKLYGHLLSETSSLALRKQSA
jgi:hypothetical protein